MFGAADKELVLGAATASARRRTPEDSPTSRAVETWPQGESPDAATAVAARSSFVRSWKSLVASSRAALEEAQASSVAGPVTEYALPEAADASRTSTSTTNETCTPPESSARRPGVRLSWGLSERGAHFPRSMRRPPKDEAVNSTICSGLVMCGRSAVLVSRKMLCIDGVNSEGDDIPLSSRLISAETTT